MTRRAKTPRKGIEGDPVIFRRHRRRVELRMTTREVAEAVGVSLATVWRWEHGVTTPDPDQIGAWEKALNEFAAMMGRISRKPGGSF